MSLGWKAGVVLALMVGVGILMLFARRKNYEGVRRHYTTRRERVPVPSATDPKDRSGGGALDENDQAEDQHRGADH